MTKPTKNSNAVLRAGIRNLLKDPRLPCSTKVLLFFLDQGHLDKIYHKNSVIADAINESEEAVRKAKYRLVEKGVLAYLGRVQLAPGRWVSAYKLEQAPEAPTRPAAARPAKVGLNQTQMDNVAQVFFTHLGQTSFCDLGDTSVSGYTKFWYVDLPKMVGRNKTIPGKSLEEKCANCILKLIPDLVQDAKAIRIQNSAGWILNKVKALDMTNEVSLVTDG